MTKKIIVAITGASGSIYAIEFLQHMVALDVEVHGIISESGIKVLDIELGLAPDDITGVNQWFGSDDFTAPAASGSSLYDGMAVLPCTMGTLAAIANGHSLNLIHRAADVMLKERRRLVLAVRETPLNTTHLRNMTLADAAGAIICPAMPAFYQRPQSITEIAADYAARVASLLDIEVVGMKRWSGVK